jgi:hypothetical protein
MKSSDERRLRLFGGRVAEIENGRNRKRNGVCPSDRPGLAVCFVVPLNDVDLGTPVHYIHGLNLFEKIRRTLEY